MAAERLGDVFDRTVAHRGDRLAIREPGRDWSWTQLGGRSEELSRLLAPYCREPGRRVGLMLPNSAAYVAGFFGIVRVGGVVAPLNPRYRAQELVYYVEDTQAAALVVAPELVTIVRDALGALPAPPAIIAVDQDACRLVADGHAPATPADAGGSPPLLHQYTSGSTGAPKRVLRTHANLLFELERLAAVFDVGEGDRFLGVAPFTHVNGLVRTMMTSMFVGATLYPLPEFKRRDVLDLVTRERLTFFGAVPYMFVILADTPARGPVDLTSLRTAFSSSAPLLPADARRFHERYRVVVRQLYGSTETGTISVNPAARALEHPESVGCPLPDVRFEVLDDRRRRLPAGTEGEVAITSPGAIRAYAGNAEASATSFHGDAYLSGDLGRLTADGFLTLTGRKKFLINRGGFKVNPLEVEEAVQAHPKVAEVAVVGAPGTHGDDVVRCVVVAREPCTAEEIVEHCRARIADYKIPSRIEFRDALPKSETGKLLRHKL